jgi:hypothetical protein
MESISYLLLLLLLLNFGAFVAFALFSVQLHHSKPAELPWRGLVKLVSLTGIPAALEQTYRKWLTTFAIFFGFTCLTVAVLVWATDHSFFVVLFPLLFYYFFARYLLWEKQDLAD